MDEDIKTAIDAPRPHHQLVPMKIQYEIGAKKVELINSTYHMKYLIKILKTFQDIVNFLRKAGHEVDIVDPYFVKNYSGARVQAVSVSANNIITANNDRRKEGEVDGF